MQILIPDSWLREYLETDAAPKDIQRCLSLCGPSIERLHEQGSDFIYDIEVTTNRVDCMSVIGIAREAVAILPRFGFSAKLSADPFTIPVVKTAPAVDYLHVKIDPRLCPRFAALLISGVSVKPSPDWLVRKLELVGMRALNNVVDISNLLMLELGQPVHTFDYDKITKSSMILRESKAGESLTTLDNQTHILPGHDIVIEDGSGRLVDLCGIMGGAVSAIDEHTKNVLLFVQTYEPIHLRQTSMTLAARSAAAVLFEKGLSPESVLPTLSKGAELLHLLAGGTPHAAALDVYPDPLPITTIKLSRPLSEFASIRLGIELKPREVVKILESLNFQVDSDTAAKVPWYRRQDICLPEDLVEEIARIYGYHNLPDVLMSGPLPDPPDTSEFHWVAKIKSALAHWGFTETYTYSLVSQGSGLKLKNPLTADWVYLRTTLTPSHLEVITDNLGRVPEISLFEIANVYLPRKHDLPLEELHLLLSTTNSNVLRFKGIIETLLHQELGLDPKSALFDIITHPVCLTCEINLSPLLPKFNLVKKFIPISKFSPIIEDININLTAGYTDLITQIKKISPLIKHIGLIDKYGSKLTLRLTFHSDTKQLSSADISPLRERLMALELE